jgi:hypothetical protein
MRTAQPQWQALELSNVFAWMVIVESLFAAHGLACSGCGS